MSEDIVARLRSNARFFNLVKLGSRVTIEPEFCKETAEWLTEAADEIERLRAEVERLRVGGCARDQTTTQFCAEAERLRNELAARCGIGGAGAHTAGPTETFIPEAL